jgi:hypothetical protein
MQIKKVLLRGAMSAALAAGGVPAVNTGVARPWPISGTCPTCVNLPLVAGTGAHWVSAGDSGLMRPDTPASN